MWVFEPTVRPFYTTHKVFVRVKAANRPGFISDVLKEDHSRCYGGAHFSCRVEVHIIRGRTISPTMVSVADIEVSRPMRNSETVLQVRGLGGGSARLLRAIAAPKQPDRPARVCTMEDPKVSWDIPFGMITKIEQLR